MIIAITSKGGGVLLFSHQIFLKMTNFDQSARKCHRSWWTRVNHCYDNVNSKDAKDGLKFQGSSYGWICRAEPQLLDNLLSPVHFAVQSFLHPKLQTAPISSFSCGDFMSNGPSNRLFSSRFVFLYIQTSLLSLFPIKKLFYSISIAAILEFLSSPFVHYTLY